MAFPFTPAQLAAFKLAMANLAEGILQGDKALGDEEYVRLNQAVMPKPEPVKPAPVAKVQEKVVPLTQQSTSPVVEVKSPVVEPPVAPNPAPAPALEASKSKSKGLFGLNWFSKKSTESTEEVKRAAPKTAGVSVKVSDKKQQEAAKPDTEVDKAARARIAEGWVANSFFAELPWSRPNEKSVAAAASSAQPVELARYYPKDTSNVGDFFASLPWSVSRPYVPASAMAVSQARVIRESVNTYFSGLPWAERKAGAEPIIVANQLVAARQTAPIGSYFQTLPWQQIPQGKAAEAIHVNNPASQEASGMFAAATQSALMAAEKGSSKKPADTTNTDKYFNALPWGGNG